MFDERPNLPKPITGKYHRNEWMIAGAPRKRAREIAFEIYSEIANDLNILFMDNDHNTDKRYPISFAGEYRFRINYYNYAYRTEFVKPDYYGMFAAFDAVLVSGNHYQTDRQIVVANKVRRKALERRIERMTNVEMFILDDVEEIFDFLLENIENADDIPVFSMEEPGEIADYLKERILHDIPDIIGWVMAGDSADIKEAQKALSESCRRVFICGNGSYETEQKLYAPEFLNMGTIGKVLTGLKNSPDTAILTYSTDVMPSKTLVDELNSYRNARKIATCFCSEDGEYPSQDFVIWEPRAYPRILQFLAQGYSDVSVILRNSEVEMVKTPSFKKLRRK